MYAPADNGLIWVQDYCCVDCWFWLACHMSKTSWTLANLCNLLSSSSHIIATSFRGFVRSTARSSPAEIRWLALGNCLTTSFLQKVLPVVFDCLQLIMPRPMEKLASTPTLCSMIENISCTTLERSVYCECVSTCCGHKSGISSIQNVLLLYIGSELNLWRFNWIWPQFCGNSDCEFK